MSLQCHTAYTIAHVKRMVVRASGYYATILSGKKDCAQWSVSTVRQFASSFYISTQNAQDPYSLLM